MTEVDLDAEKSAAWWAKVDGACEVVSDFLVAHPDALGTLRDEADLTRVYVAVNKGTEGRLSAFVPSFRMGEWPFVLGMALVSNAKKQRDTGS